MPWVTRNPVRFHMLFEATGVRRRSALRAELKAGHQDTKRLVA